MTGATSQFCLGSSPRSYAIDISNLTSTICGVTSALERDKLMAPVQIHVHARRPAYAIAAYERSSSYTYVFGSRSSSSSR
jgi:hypothetical protein